MSKEYDDITAKHYAAFRPPLHAAILSRCIDGDRTFDAGMDIGCGTGRSAVALAKYCVSVIGVDPNQEMLDNAVQHPRITYLNSDGEQLNFENDYFDIITFAGSLFYAKSQGLCDEVVRSSKLNSKIIVYDFEILLQDSLRILDLDVDSSSAAIYDHEVNFSGLINEKLAIVERVKGMVSLNIGPSDLTHLLLSEKVTYPKLEKKLGLKNLFEKVQDKLNTELNGKNHRVQANIFFTAYENKKQH